MIWDTALETGITTIDDQHKQLFDRVETLLYHKDEASLRAALDYIGDYAAAHFKDEEAMMERLGYPQYKAHKQLHDENVDTFAALCKAYDEQGGTLPMALAIYDGVMDWIKHHIMDADMRFAAYCRGLETTQEQAGF